MKKEPMQPNTVTSTTTRSHGERMDVTFIPNPHPIQDYFVNENDKDDEKIKKQLYDLAMAAKPLFNSTALNSFIISKAKEKMNDCFDLKLLPAVLVHADGNIRSAMSNLMDLVNHADFTHKPTNPRARQDLQNYTPAIHVRNAATGDVTLRPFFSSGTCNH